MNSEIVERFVYANKKYFPESGLNTIRQRLRESPLNTPDDIWRLTNDNGLKNPTVGLVLSLFFVPFDRFYVGDYGLMVAKLLTLAGFGFWGIVDWFLIPKRCCEVNMENFLFFLNRAEEQEYRAREEAHRIELMHKAAELKQRARIERDNHISQHGYDAYAAQIDRDLDRLELAEYEAESRRIANDRYNETMAALQKQNELIEESNKIARRHAEDEEFWNIMRYYK